MRKFFIRNLDCAHCAMKIENALKKLDFVEYVSIDFPTLSMKIKTKDIQKVKEEIKKIEPEIEIVESDKYIHHDHDDFRFDLKRETIFLSSMIFSYFTSLFVLRNLHPFISDGIFVLIYILGGYIVFKGTFDSLKKGKIFDEHFLMCIATIGAIAIGKLEEATAVMLFYRTGKFLESLSVNNSRESVKNLLELKVEYVNLITPDGLVKVKPEDVEVGSEIIVRTGEKIPLDGVVVEGNSYVDTSPITGENLPKFLKEGDKVFGGSIVKEGILKVKVTKHYKDSSISKIIEFLEEASHRKSRTEMFFTKFASIYTPAVIMLTLVMIFLQLLVFGIPFKEALYRSLVVLVISCPCSLVISIPLSYFAGIGALSKSGILVKGADCVDKLNDIKAIYFDKTGTITKGEFKIREIYAMEGVTPDEILEVAAKVGSNSNHLIAKSIRENYGKDNLICDISDYKEYPGMGVTAIVDGRKVILGNDRILHYFDISHEKCNFSDTTVNISIDFKYAGHIVIGDSIKEEAYDTIRHLKDLGIDNITILSGDNGEATNYVASSLNVLGIGELLPNEKANIVSESGKSAFVGDGINDSLALSRAYLGIAMGGKGTDLSLEYSDIVITDDNLLKIPLAISISKRVRNIIIQNIVFSLSVKFLFVVLGFLGIAEMWEAVFADVGVTIITVFNSLRILRQKPLKT